jgi:hypothetical protein
MQCIRGTLRYYQFYLFLVQFDKTMIMFFALASDDDALDLFRNIISAAPCPENLKSSEQTRSANSQQLPLQLHILSGDKLANGHPPKNNIDVQQI